MASQFIILLVDDETKSIVKRPIGLLELQQIGMHSYLAISFFTGNDYWTQNHNSLSYCKKSQFLMYKYYRFWLILSPMATN